MDEFVRGVINHLYLLHHHHPLLFKFRRVKDGIQKNVGKYIYGKRNVFIQDLCVKAGIFPACEGVKHPSHGLNVPGYVKRLSFTGAFKEEVFDEMGYAAFMGALAPWSV